MLSSSSQGIRHNVSFSTQKHAMRERGEARCATLQSKGKYANVHDNETRCRRSHWPSHLHHLHLRHQHHRPKAHASSSIPLDSSTTSHSVCTRVRRTNHSNITTSTKVCILEEVCSTKSSWSTTHRHRSHHRHQHHRPKANASSWTPLDSSTTNHSVYTRVRHTNHSNITTSTSVCILEEVCSTKSSWSTTHLHHLHPRHQHHRPKAHASSSTPLDSSTTSRSVCTRVRRTCATLPRMTTRRARTT